MRRVVTAGIRLDGASDHGISEAIYLRDPDGNGVELAWDRPEEAWPRTPDGGIPMVTLPLDLDALRAWRDKFPAQLDADAFSLE